MVAIKPIGALRTKTQHASEMPISIRRKNVSFFKNFLTKNEKLSLIWMSVTMKKCQIL